MSSSWSTSKHTLRHVTIFIKTSSHILSMGATSYKIRKKENQKNPKANMCSTKQFLSFLPLCVRILKSQGKTRACLFLYPVLERKKSRCIMSFRSRCWLLLAIHYSNPPKTRRFESGSERAVALVSTCLQLWPFR